MGWFVESYRGRVRVHHGRAIDGFVSMVTFLPGEGVGVVALANLGGTALPGIVAREVIDRLLGLPPIDWSARLLQRREAGRKADNAGRYGKTDIPFAHERYLEKIDQLQLAIVH